MALVHTTNTNDERVAADTALSLRLVVLSGGVEHAARAVSARWPNALVDTLDKERLRGPDRWKLLGELRRQRCDLFVFYTYVNAWQLGRFLMALYALLSGARRVVLLDIEGAVEEFGPGRILLREAPRTGLEYALSIPLVLIGLVASWLLGLFAKPSRRGYPDSARSTERPLDVLFVRPTPTIGVMEAGESAHIRGVLDGLVELGHHPRVLSNDDLPAIRRARHDIDIRRPGALFNATPLAFELWNNFVFTWHLWRAARLKRPDVIYQRYSRNSWAGVAVARLLGLPLLLEWNGSEVWATRHWTPFIWWARIVGVYERVNRIGADHIVVVSETLARALSEHGVSRHRILVNPNGVDPERFHPDSGGEAIRARYDLGHGTVVGFVGSFNYYQGTPVLMRAASEVCRRTDARFLLVGYGETLAATRDAARDAGVSDRVVFTDRVPVDDVPAFVDACDITVAPMAPPPDGSDFFNSPVKIFEYMAAGKAIVASRLGQIVEIIEDGVTGLLVAPDDPDALAAAIIRLAENPDERARFGRVARERAVAQHTWRRNAERALAAYDEVIGRRS